MKFSAESNELGLLKTTESGQKMAKTNVVRETPKWLQSEAKD